MKLTLEESMVTAGEQMIALNKEYESCIARLEMETHWGVIEAFACRELTLKRLDKVLSEITLLRSNASCIVRSAIRETVSKMDKQQPANSLVEWKAYCNYGGGYRVHDEFRGLVCSDLSSTAVMQAAVQASIRRKLPVKFTYWAETPDGIEQAKPFGPPDSLQGDAQ